MVFLSGQAVGDKQCVTISILDDSNVLEYSEYFQLVVTSLSSIVVVPPGHEAQVIQILEDPQDGK